MAKRVRDPYDDRAFSDAIVRNDFAAFAMTFFPVVSNGVELVWAPYLDLIAAKLGAMVLGESRHLIITVPPRHLKSILASGMLPAFFLGHYPSKEVMCVSYGMELSSPLGEQTRKIMSSPRYAEVFGTRLSSLRQPARQLRTTEGGARRATSLEGVATGIGADFLIFDDAQKPDEALSEAVRRSSNGAFERTFLSRRNNPRDARIVVVMQRLHEDDFVGHIQGLNMGWEVINLPVVAEADEAIAYSTFDGEHVFRRREGEALNPARVPIEELNRIRNSVGEAIWAAQYQQRPTPAGGGIVKLEWLQPFDPEAPHEPYEQIVQSWDTANKTEEWHDYSVCTTWGVRNKKFYLLHVFRERLNYPQLRDKVLDLANTWNATRVLIEDHASGTQLLQELKTLGFYKAVGCHHDRDKAMRMSNQTGAMSNGAVFVPKDAPWRSELLHELAMFPNGRYDDQVDSISQALAYLTAGKASGWLEYMAEWAAEVRAKGEGRFIDDDEARWAEMDRIYEEDSWRNWG